MILKNSQVNSLKSPLDILPIEIKELFQFIFNRGFYLVMIGGAVRKFLSAVYDIGDVGDVGDSDLLGLDLDFEIRFEQREQREQEHPLCVLSKLKDELLNNFSQNIIKNKIILNDFGILIFNYCGYNLELSIPRIEKFKNNDFSHKNFTLELDFQLPYKEAFARRDFSINAIGVEIRELNTFNTFKIIDPYNGVVDLKNKILRPISGVFHKDPVRFLRAIRFHVRDSFAFSSELLQKFSFFDLRELSIHYFYLETIKSREFVRFVKLFYKLLDEYHIGIKLSEKISNLKILTCLPEDLVIDNSDMGKEDFLKMIWSNFSSFLSIEDFSLLWISLECSKKKLKFFLKVKRRNLVK
ncbi:MAG: CCA tRNA nucleotidyltransferase [Oligoflexia bacterium]|nr:CCA tRNA nucleotidyltransferase [Oligoflexia bacterium]